jgi:hypothetical protein
LGQLRDHSALAVLRREERFPAGTVPLYKEITKKESHYAVVHLVRWKLGVAYDSIVADVRKLIDRPPLPGCRVAVDASGVGRPIVDLLRTEIRQGMKATLHPIVLTGGLKATATPTGWHVPKYEMTSVLQVLFQGQRLKAADLPERPQLLRELRNYSVKLNPRTGHASYEAINESIHDDLCIAVGLPCWLAEKGTVKPGSLRVINLRSRNAHPLSEKELQGRLHVVVCKSEELAGVEIDDHSAFLICVEDPPLPGQVPDETTPPNGLTKLQGTLKLRCTAHDPAEHGASWNEPIVPFGRPVNELALSVQDARRFWLHVRRQDPPPQVLVISSPDGQIALSVAQALCDQLRIDRAETIYQLGSTPEEKYTNVQVRHVYNRIREARELVV